MPLSPVEAVLPVPARIDVLDEPPFEITPATLIVVPAGDPGVAGVGARLAEILGAAVTAEAADAADGGAIVLDIVGAARDELGDEGYRLTVRRGGVTLAAATTAGLFYGVQTIRQLLSNDQLPAVDVTDRPRFPYRGFMLDVGRHFFGVAEVKRLIGLISQYKTNHLHLHLTDDQGWRIAVESWPNLTGFGSGTEVGAGPGGYFTKDDYREIVEHAARHFVTVVPEIDLPGHTNAALASYPELNCDGVAPDRYTGIEVGFSSLCVDKELTYRFLDDVFGELAAITPGPYLHIGGDEAKTLDPQDYATIVERAQAIVARHGKTVIGWHEIAAAPLLDSTVTQFWGITPEAPEVTAAVANGQKVIMSPANRAYLDIKYDEHTALGLHWPGYVEVDAAYDWDPATYLAGVGEDDVLGVEAPLWTETVTGADEIDFLVFPRLAAIAEIAWSPAASHDWQAVRRRLAAQGPRWASGGVNFYRSPLVPWPL